jgi:hypothetical protein
LHAVTVDRLLLASVHDDVWSGFSRFPTTVTSLYIVRRKHPFTRHPAATLSKRAGKLIGNSEKDPPEL